MPVTSLKLTSETFLIVGLQNGNFQGWNLTDNGISTLPAHPQSVDSLFKHHNYLISGDAGGEIKVFDHANSFNLVL